MTEHDDALSLDMVTAALRADSTDVAIYARVLAQSLGEALPADCVSVERDRSMSDRMRGRPGEISKVVARLGELQMTLAVRNGQPVAEVCRAVRGVVLSRQTVPIGDWAATLAGALVSYAEQNAQAAQALRRLVAGGLGRLRAGPGRGQSLTPIPHRCQAMFGRPEPRSRNWRTPSGVFLRTSRDGLASGRPGRTRAGHAGRGRLPQRRRRRRGSG